MFLQEIVIKLYLQFSVMCSDFRAFLSAVSSCASSQVLGNISSLFLETWLTHDAIFFLNTWDFFRLFEDDASPCVDRLNMLSCSNTSTRKATSWSHMHSARVRLFESFCERKAVISLLSPSVKVPFPSKASKLLHDTAPVYAHCPGLYTAKSTCQGKMRQWKPDGSW